LSSSNSAYCHNTGRCPLELGNSGKTLFHSIQHTFDLIRFINAFLICFHETETLDFLSETRLRPRPC